MQVTLSRGTKGGSSWPRLVRIFLCRSFRFRGAANRIAPFRVKHPPATDWTRIYSSDLRIMRCLTAAVMA